MAHPRATINVKRHRLPIAQEQTPPPKWRPQTRADCVNGPRPCGYVACRFHLYLDVKPNGNIRLNFPDELDEMDGLDRMPESCVLDVADRDGATLEFVGYTMGVTREMVRQMEIKIYKKLAVDEHAIALARSLETMHGPEVDGSPTRARATGIGGGVQGERGY